MLMIASAFVAMPPVADARPQIFAAADALLLMLPSCARRYAHPPMRYDAARACSARCWRMRTSTVITRAESVRRARAERLTQTRNIARCRAAAALTKTAQKRRAMSNHSARLLNVARYSFVPPHHNGDFCRRRRIDHGYKPVRRAQPRSVKMQRRQPAATTLSAPIKKRNRLQTACRQAESSAAYAPRGEVAGAARGAV